MSNFRILCHAVGNPIIVPAFCSDDGRSLAESRFHSAETAPNPPTMVRIAPRRFLGCMQSSAGTGVVWFRKRILPNRKSHSPNPQAEFHHRNCDPCYPVSQFTVNSNRRRITQTTTSRVFCHPQKALKGSAGDQVHGRLIADCAISGRSEDMPRKRILHASPPMEKTRRMLAWQLRRLVCL